MDNDIAYFERLNAEIAPPDAAAERACRDRWDAVAKPLGSLGLLEDAVAKIAALTGDAEVSIRPRAVVPLCADNGVTAQPVAATPASVTATLAALMGQGRTSVCLMAKQADTEVVPVDMGLFTPVPGILDRRIAAGTADMSRGPAMTRGQLGRAIETGIGLVRDLKARGIRLIATGEAGIGNTSTSAALAAALLGCDARLTTGRGAGLDDAAYAKKTGVVGQALKINSESLSDPAAALAALGGFDIAGMAGLFIGGALYRIPVLIDGYISAVAALAASRLCPACLCAPIATHSSAEPGARRVLEALGLRPMIYADLRLGEGTGAVAAIPMLDMALAVYTGAATYADIDMGGEGPGV